MISRGNRLLKLGVAFGVLISQVSMAAKNEFNLNVFADSYFFTLAPDVMTTGPILPEKNSGDLVGQSEYIRKVFRHLIKKADAMIHDDVKMGYVENSNTNFSYFTFLVLALTVPHHESGLVHWRKTNSKGCSPGANTLNLSPVGTRNILSAIYRNPLYPLFPNCNELPSDQILTQVLASGNHDDLGIMQVNTRWHSTHAEPAIYLNIFNSIDYGIEYVYEGFKELTARTAKNSGALGCTLNFDPYKQKNTRAKPNFNLIRATWAGRYNSGSQICRFSTDFAFDAAFLKSLSGILLSGNSLFHQHLPPGTVEREALDEIVGNFKAIFTDQLETEKNTALKALLRLPPAPYTVWQAPARAAPRKMTHLLKPGKYTIYSAPVENAENACGTIASQPFGFLPIEPVLQGSQSIAPKSQALLQKRLLNAIQARGSALTLVNIPNMALYAKLNLSSDSTSAACRSGQYYIKTSAITEAPIKYVSGNTYRAEISANGTVNLRSNAGTQFRIVGTVKNGDEIVVQSDQRKSTNLWFEVLTADGVTGWVNSNAVYLRELIN